MVSIGEMIAIYQLSLMTEPWTYLVFLLDDVFDGVVRFDLEEQCCCIVRLLLYRAVNSIVTVVNT